MINIVVTAGGTSENIDQVRKITNTSTGALGSKICEELEMYLQGHEFKIHYIMGSKAIKPQIKSDNVIFYLITDTESLINSIEQIFEDYKIDYFIHAMAVSDFTTSYTVPVSSLAKELASEIYGLPFEMIEKKVVEILKSPQAKLKRDQKISSKEDILVGLTRTPKVINKIKKLDPDVFLVGFKLLDGVDEDYLVEVAKELGKVNKCDLVLANDASHITKDEHKAILIKNQEIVDRYSTKDEIAKGIVQKMLGELR